MNPTDEKTQQTQSGKEGGDVAKVSLYEKHQKIYVRSVRGWWANWRWILVFGTQLLFYGLPWLQWNGRQAVLFHLVERKFYLFGLVLWPQDVFYLALLLIISAYGLFLFTAVAGRLFCGYACPQTVYTEIFLWIERLVEGDRPARIKLDRAQNDARKFRLKITKHALWLVLSIWTGFTLVGYFTPMSELRRELPTFAFGPWEGFWIFFYAGFTYMMAGFMREQVCKYMCPYARFQSVMFDPDTLVITYDSVRGEPRGLRRKGKDSGELGDCVDCGICVQVCPTGIDIRNGLQYECIGCGACIDACDEVMDKVGKPRGLVRYTSENALAKRYTETDILGHVLRPRIILYTVILLLLTAASIWSLAVRVPLKVDLIRDRSVLAREVDDGSIENVYIIKIMNTAERAMSYRISVSGLPGVILSPDTATEVQVGAAENREVTVKVRVPPDTEAAGSHRIYFDVVAEDDASVAVHEKASFLLP
jgi:cytochrome c oxidase accessory protein FixG